MKIIDMKRLIADEGKILSNGTVQGNCIDVFADNIDEWTEIEADIEE